MKREELMIGDWILCYDNIKPCKVLAISDEGVNVCGFFEKVPFGLAKPIPITPEILEKNGIYPVEADNMVVCKSMDKSIEVSFSKESIWTYIDVPACTISSIGIRYVHELQHALRLCKIDKEIIL